jgi:two-component system CAI-1 autoinducer sensor kinase/phosphatase CqsS
LMCLQSGHNIIWVLDLIGCFALLLMFTNKKSTFLIALVGLAMASSIHFVIGNGSYTHINVVGYWSFALHIITLVGCLFLFRKKDAQRYRILSGKLAHEASRSMSSLTASAEFLKQNLPNLITGYEWAYKNGFQGRSINKDIIDELKALPPRLQEMGHRTSKTVDSLLNKICAIKAKSGNHTLVDILSCVQHAVADPSITVEQRSKIDIVRPYSFFVLGEHSQISQAILNIIENALYAIATKPKGRISIWAEGNSLFIRDNGIGISKGDLPNIFDEFFSTKKTLGQGLSFCQQVMSEHNGSIQCESDENHFTQFELIFPRWS